MAHAIRFEEQRGFERAGGHSLEIIGPVEPGGAVEVGRAHLFEWLEIVVVGILRPIEHQMLEQVGEAGLARRLILRPDMIPDRDRDDGRLAVLVHDHAQAVRQDELLIGNGHRLDELAHRRGSAAASGSGANRKAAADRGQKTQHGLGSLGTGSRKAAI